MAWAYVIPVKGQSCQLVVPENALTGSGLATPYILKGNGCSQTDLGSVSASVDVHLSVLQWCLSATKTFNNQ